MTLPTKQEPRLIIMAAGGTGGHVYPAMAVAEVIREAHREIPIVFLGTAGGAEARLVPAGGWTFEAVAAKGLRGKSWWQSAVGALWAAAGTLQCLWRFWKVRPAAVVALSGYASVPAAVAAAVLEVPVVWHEQNISPGWSTWLGGRLADRLLAGFPPEPPESGSAHVTVVGNPLRHAALEGSREGARKKFNIGGSAKVVLVVGGSQGSRALNGAMLNQWKHILERVPQAHWIWLTGNAHGVAVRTQLEGTAFPGTVLEYYDAMGELYAAADVAVARAGALTLSELAAWGLPAVLVPIERSGGGHQVANALWFEERGASETVREGAVQGLAEAVIRTLSDPRRYAVRCRNMQALGRRSAAAQMARIVMEYVV